jgi:hypothetical protein
MKVLLSGALAAVVIAASACSPAPEPPAPAPKPAVEKVHFEDAHIRFVEYALYPGANMVDAVPYPSVLMTDAAWPEVTEAAATGDSPTQAETNSDTVLPFDGRPYPNCRVESPRAAKVVTVNGEFPKHFYRVEYKRVDGKDYAANWQTWYADVFAAPARATRDPGLTLKGKEPSSKEWPYHAGYSPTVAAPANHVIRYQDDHVELIEVVIRPGETENMHGHPYPSVYADDGGFSPAGAVYQNQSIEPDFTVPWGMLTSPFDAGVYPICFSAIPEPPHKVSVKSGPPQHFYRVHFKRVDGDDVKTNWRSWYPAP